MKNRWFVSFAALLVIAALGFAQGLLKLEARMAGNGNDKGKAKWVTKGAQGELQVEAENLVPNATYHIQIDTNVPWSADTDALGNFRLNQVYRGASRPIIGNGSSVTVTDGDGNTTLSGTFRGR